MADDNPIPMSEFHLGERYSSEDMYRDYPDLKVGDRFTVKRDGVVYTATVESVHYSSGSPAVYRELNRWQRLVRRLTPPRWRRPLLIREAEAPSFRINGEPDQAGKTLEQIEAMKDRIRQASGRTMNHQPPTYFDDLYESSLLNAVRASDQANPGRICAWCFHPRNSDECQFAAKHAPYVEHFGGVT